jgi:DNA-binding NtrC family response regulator
MFINENKTLREYSNDIISYYLKKHNQDVVEVAKMLDIGKSTIYSLIQKKEIKIN